MLGRCVFLHGGCIIRTEPFQLLCSVGKVQPLMWQSKVLRVLCMNPYKWMHYKQSTWYFQHASRQLPLYAVCLFLAQGIYIIHLKQSFYHVPLISLLLKWGCCRRSMLKAWSPGNEQPWCCLVGPWPVFCLLLRVSSAQTMLSQSQARLLK